MRRTPTANGTVSLSGPAASPSQAASGAPPAAGSGPPRDGSSSTGPGVAPTTPRAWGYALTVVEAHVGDATASRTVPVLSLKSTDGAVPPGVTARVEETLAATMRAQVRRFDRELAGLPGGAGPPSLTISARTVTQRDWLLAVRLDVTADFGGANPQVRVDSLVFDLRTGRALTLGELFGGQLAPVDTALPR